MTLNLHEPFILQTAFPTQNTYTDGSIDIANSLYRYPDQKFSDLVVPCMETNYSAC